MKYNKSEIMKNAWSLYRKMKAECPNVANFGNCLRTAWATAKRNVSENAQAGKDFHNGMEITACYTTFTLNRWQSYGKDRIYINLGTRNIGYLDVKSGNIYGAPRKLSADAAKAHEIVKSLAI